MDKGARYYKCDFQVHSPRDINFIGANYLTDEERFEYAKKFIKECRNKKIDAVAITDHHDLMFFNFIKSASIDEVDSNGVSVDENQRIVIFPGMELTLDVPCQSLLIFDSDLDMTDELIIKIYTALKISGHTPKHEIKTGETKRLAFKSNNDIYDALGYVQELKGRYIILPNIKDRGTSSILRDGFFNEYANGVFVGGYLDRGLFQSHKGKVGWNKVIDGEVEAYGYRSVGIFQTSDNRTDTFENLGVSATWVKWSTATAEGLRQACLAKKSRILQDEPKLPTTRIKKIKITGSNFLKDLEVELNPQFNVCIGGRGTGKSSLLQYISWALGKDSGPEKKEDLENFINNTLGSGNVELTIIKTGIQHIIKRSTSAYQIKIGSDEWQLTNSQNIVSIIRTDSFSQKELSKHERNKKSQLIRIIENAVSSGLESIKRQLNENGNRIKEVSASYETYISNLKSSDDLKAQISSIEEQINSLNEQLIDIPSTDQVIIKDNSLIGNEKSLVKQSENLLNAIKNQIDQIIKSGNFIPLSVNVDKVKNSTEITNIIYSHNEITSSIKTVLESTAAKFASIDLTNKKLALDSLHGLYDIEYTRAKNRQNKFELIIQDLEELRNRLAVLTSDRDRIQKTLESERGTRKLLQNLFYQRNQLNINLCDLIKGAVIDIVGKSEGTIEIKLLELENTKNIIDKFLDNVTGSKGQPQRTQIFFDSLLKGKKTYKELLKFWFSVYRAQTEGKKIEEILPSYALENTSLLDTDFERIKVSLSTALILDFSLQLPSYDLELFYRKDLNNKIPFEMASYGQQAGSILTILLNQEFGPLIIDQPEDDLDNKVIHQITERIIDSKHKRQLIFSSHNANIAVNGDAELILVFDHNSDKSSGEIIESGSIDKNEIKLRVKDIMEGGVKAFELRKTKYGF